MDVIEIPLDKVKGESQKSPQGLCENWGHAQILRDMNLSQKSYSFSEL